MQRRVFQTAMMLAALLLLPAAAMAQEQPATVVAVPQLATPENVATSAGDTGLIARYSAESVS